jgi:hypothetical protein
MDDQSYYPSAKIRLNIRFEDFGKGPVPDKAQSFLKPITIVKGDVDPSQRLPVTRDTSAPGLRRWRVGNTKTSPQQQDASKDGLTHTLGGVVPRKATWSQNGIRAADTLSFKLRYIDAPLDPRCIRSCGVEFWLGTVTADDFARGVAGARRQSGGSEDSDAGEPLSMVPDFFLDPSGVERSNLRFEGFIDKWKVNWDESGEAMIQVECRDNTQLFIDLDAPGNVRIKGGKPFDEAVADYLANFKQFDGLAVEYRPGTVVPPDLKDVFNATAYPPTLGPAPAKGGGGGKLSVWDYITDVCGALGHNARIEGTTLIIQTLSNLLTDTRRRPDDPFQGRPGADGQQEYRRFIYGNNILKMSAERIFAQKGGPVNIEARSYLPHRKKPLVSRFPKKEDRAMYALPGDKASSEQKWSVILANGVYSQAALDEFAKGAYFSLGKNELQVSVTTKSLASFGGGNLQPDVLDMKTGDTFEVLVDRAKDGEEWNSLVATDGKLLQEEAAKAYLAKLGFGGKFADAYARSYADASFQTQFRLKAMQTEWDADEGVSLSLNGANFTEVRLDPALKAKNQEPTGDLGPRVKGTGEASKPPKKK